MFIKSNNITIISLSTNDNVCKILNVYYLYYHKQFVYWRIFFFVDAPKIQPFHFPEDVKIGHNIVVTCAVMKGKTPLKFMWLKDGKSLRDAATVNNLEKASNLFIDPVMKSSSGNYTCVAENAIGRNSYSALLNVKGKFKWKIYCNIFVR